MGRLIVFTGSGISVESGIPTYRADKGLWNEYDVTKVCDIRTWLDNYELVHEFYNKRRVELSAVKPNHTHDVIAEWQKKYDTILMTQNVDNLHEQAGSTKIIHLHGQLTKLQCQDPSCQHTWDIGYTEFDTKNGHCPRCGNKVIKPAVVFFNEMAPEYALFNRIIDSLKPDDVVVVLGTSGQVIPIDYYLSGKPSYNILNNLSPRTSDNGVEMAMNGYECWSNELYVTSSKGVDIISETLTGVL